LIFIFLAVVAFIAGSAHSGITKDTLRHFVEIIIGISLYFVVTNSVRWYRHLRQIVIVIIFAGFLASLIGVILYLLPKPTTVRVLSVLRIFHYPSGWSVLRFVEDDPELPLRAISTSVDPNVLGGLLIMITSLTIPQLVAQRPLLRKMWIAPMLATMAACLVLTFSRGAFVAIGAIAVFLGAIRYRRLLLVMALVGTIILVLPQTQEYIQHFRSGILIQDRATLMRLGEYKDALTLISRYPWFGVGFGGTPSIDLYIGVSNVYLLIAEEMGLIGLSSFLLIMGVFLAYAWRAWRRMETDSDAEPILLGLMMALLGAMVGGIVDHYFFNLDFPHSVSLFWLYVGLAVVAIKIGEKRGSRHRGVEVAETVAG
jgi:O-antigen ligase